MIGALSGIGDRQWGGARDRNSTIELSENVRQRSATLIG
jgi:hypothetical protein